MSWINDAKKEASEKDSEIEAELIQILGSTLTEIEQVLLYAQDQGLILKPFKLVHSYVNTHIGNEGDFNSGGGQKAYYMMAELWIPEDTPGRRSESGFVFIGVGLKRQKDGTNKPTITAPEVKTKIKKWLVEAFRI